jgi:hypothetical protein
MVNPQYFLRDGEVWLRRTIGDETHVCGGSSKLAVAIEIQDGILYKHGSAEKVSKWADGHRQKAIEHPELATFFAVEVIEFQINQAVLDELNRCVATSGRIAGFVKFLSEQHPSDFGPSFPD